MGLFSSKPKTTILDLLNFDPRNFFSDPLYKKTEDLIKDNKFQGSYYERELTKPEFGVFKYARLLKFNDQANVEDDVQFNYFLLTKDDPVTITQIREVTNRLANIYGSDGNNRLWNKEDEDTFILGTDDESIFWQGRMWDIKKPVAHGVSLDFNLEDGEGFNLVIVLCKDLVNALQ